MSPWQIVLVLLASILGEASDASSRKGPVVESQVCMPYTLVKRSTTSGCYASWFEKADQGSKKICLSAVLFRKWIDEPIGRCQNVRGKLKIVSPLGLSETRDEHITHSVFNVLGFARDSNDTETGIRLWALIEQRREAISRVLARYDSLGIYRSLLVSETEPSGKINILRVAGFVHLANATGIHLYLMISVLTVCFTSLMSMLRQRFPRFAHRLSEARVLALISALLFVIYLWALQGFRLGFFRPVFVVGLRSAARTLGLKWSLLQPLFILCVFEIFYVNIFDIHTGSEGEWTSIGQRHYLLAVGGGVIAYEWSKEKSSFVLHSMMAVGSWLLCAYLSVVEDALIAPFTPLLTLLTLMPIVMIVWPILIFTLFAGSASIFESHLVAFNEFLLFLSKLEFQYGMILSVNPSLLASSVIVAMLLSIVCRRVFWKRFLFWKIAATIVIFGGCFVYLHSMAHPAPTAAQWDVGQGDAFFYRDQKHSFAIDLGSDESGKLVDWWKALAHEKILKLHQVYLTHLDRDHAGNLFRVSSLIPVHEVHARSEHWNTERGQCMAQLIREGQTQPVVLDKGQSIYGGKPLHLAPAKKRGGNQWMIGFLLFFDENTAYINMGDASSESEQKSVANLVHDLKASNIKHVYLKASHHGSKHSSSMKLLSDIKFSEVWISSGRQNTYGHPHAQMLSRIGETPVLRTDHLGAIKKSWRLSSELTHPASNLRQ